MDMKTSWCRIVACASGVLFFVFLTGCSSPVDPDFAAVSAQLDSGGTYYRISDSRELFQTAGALYSQVERSLAEASAGNEKVMIAASALKLAVRFSGISGCRWSGASSIRLPDVVEKTYRNKTFYLLPENTPGIIWQIPGKENRPLLQELSGLPADTLFAGDFILDLQQTGELLAASQNGNQLLDPHCRMIFGAGIRDMLKNISGEWGFAVFPAEHDPEEYEFVLTLPEHGGKIFKALCLFAKNMPGARRDTGLLQLHFPGKSFSPVITWADDCLTVFSSGYAREHFLASGTKLGSQPDFKRLAYGLPENGLGIFYSAGVRPETRTLVLPVGNDQISVDPSVFDRPQMTVTVRGKNGLSVISNSGFDLQASDFVNLAVQPVAAILENWKTIAGFLPEKLFASTVDVPSSRSDQPVRNTDAERACRKNFDRIAGAFSAYAKKHGGMPDDMDIAGIRKVVAAGGVSLTDLVCPGSRDEAVSSAELLDFNSCSYVYWGAWRSGHPKLPLLIDRPENHGDRFHVLFNDGSVELLQLRNSRSFRRIAGFLHTGYSYSEDDFRELIRRAAELDRLFYSH